jgi:hypothetical protein
MLKESDFLNVQNATGTCTSIPSIGINPRLTTSTVAAERMLNPEGCAHAMLYSATLL